MYNFYFSAGDTLSDTNTFLLNLEDIGKFGKACPRSKARNKTKSMSAKTKPTSAKTGNADDVKQRLHAFWDDRSRDLKAPMKHMMLMECSPGSIYPENMKFSDCNVQIGGKPKFSLKKKVICITLPCSHLIILNCLFVF